MPRPNRGKSFEARFREDFRRAFPDSFLMRLADNTSGYFGASRNPCDFIAFVGGTLHLVETKSHYGNTFPFSLLRQYEALESYSKFSGVRADVIVWMIDHDKVLFAPIDAIRKMKADGKKSINVKDFREHGIKEVPSRKLRTFLASDYSEIF